MLMGPWSWPWPRVLTKSIERELHFSFRLKKKIYDIYDRVIFEIFFFEFVGVVESIFLSVVIFNIVNFFFFLFVGFLDQEFSCKSILLFLTTHLKT